MPSLCISALRNKYRTNIMKRISLASMSTRTVARVETQQRKHNSAASMKEDERIGRPARERHDRAGIN